MTTLLEFATDNVLTPLLVKERAKYLGRNRSDKHDTLNKRVYMNESTLRLEYSAFFQ